MYITKSIGMFLLRASTRVTGNKLLGAVIKPVLLKVTTLFHVRHKLLNSFLKCILKNPDESVKRQDLQGHVLPPSSGI